jgi:RNA polymerase sigma factor (sigma-70 family)
VTVAEEGELLARAAVDMAAFEAVYRRYVGNVTAFAVTRCRSAADVADVVAQTFVRLLQVADRFDHERGAPLSFILAIAGNTVRDHYQGTQRRARLVHRLAGRDMLDGDETERVEAALDAARAAAAAEAALAEGPAGDEEVVRMVAAGASPTEAASALGISPGAARGRLFRARRRLQAQLTHEPEEREQ